MRTAMLFISCLLAVPVAVATACSSSSSSGGGAGGSIFCSATLGGLTPICFGYSNLNADQQNTVNNECKQSLMGTVTTSCPTAGIIGCCKSTQGGIQTEECYYQSSGGEGGVAGDAGVDTSA